MNQDSLIKDSTLQNGNFNIQESLEVDQITAGAAQYESAGEINPGYVNNQPRGRKSNGHQSPQLSRRIISPSRKNNEINQAFIQLREPAKVPFSNLRVQLNKLESGEDESNSPLLSANLRQRSHSNDFFKLSDHENGPTPHFPLIQSDDSDSTFEDVNNETNHRNRNQRTVSFIEPTSPNQRNNLFSALDRRLRQSLGGTIRGTDSDISARYKAPVNKRYILVALLASLLLGISQTIRGIISYDVFTTKFLISFTFLIYSSLYFLYLKYKAKKNGEYFYMPWYKSHLGTFNSLQVLLSGTGKQEIVLEFDASIFSILLIGGVCEFIGSIMVLMAYRQSLSVNVNQGICSAMLSFDGVIVTIFSYYFYREKVQWPQLTGIILVVVSVCLIVLFRPINDAFFGQFGVVHKNILEGSFAIGLLCALSASIFFAIEGLFIRYLDQKGVPGNVAAFCYLFFEGLIGTTCLIIYTIAGQGIFDVTLSHFVWTVAAGCLIATGIVLTNMSLSKGIAGVVFSIVNCSFGLQTIVGQVILGQTMTKYQIAGIFLTLFGACLMALSEQIKWCVGTCCQVIPIIPQASRANNTGSLTRSTLTYSSQSPHS